MAKVLVKHGVLSKQMEVIAVADKELIAHEYMPSGERQNQRAEVYIEY